MKKYNPNKYLTWIHIPKTGGVSVKNIVVEWFRPNVLGHYTGKELQFTSKIIENVPNSVVIGHFNRKNGHGVGRGYDSSTQYITILRDPLETVLSHYFYKLKERRIYPANDLNEMIEESEWYGWHHFPMQCTPKTWKEYMTENFVAVGITERMNDSMRMIARLLNKKFIPVQKLNTTKRDDISLSEKSIQIFKKRNIEAYEMYDYFLNKLNSDEV